jgi:hypothetical protein
MLSCQFAGNLRLGELVDPARHIARLHCGTASGGLDEIGYSHEDPLLPGCSRPERPCLTYFKRCEDAGENRARSGESRVERLAGADAAQSSVHLLASSGRAFFQTRDPVAEFLILLLQAIDLFIGPNHVRRDLRDFRQQLVLHVAHAHAPLLALPLTSARYPAQILVGTPSSQRP